MKIEILTSAGNTYFAHNSKDASLDALAKCVFNHNGYLTDTVDYDGRRCLVNTEHIVAIREVLEPGQDQGGDQT